MVPDSIRNHPFWDEPFDPYDQSESLPNFKDFILKEYGYDSNPAHATPTGTPPPMAYSHWRKMAESKDANPEDLFFLALSQWSPAIVEYALKNRKFPIDKMDLFLELYRLEVDHGMYLLHAGTYTRYKAILSNKNMPASTLLDYLGSPESKNYTKRLKGVLAHPNVPEYFLIDLLENCFTNDRYEKSDIEKIIQCIEIVASNRRGITTKVARLIVEGDKRFVKSRALAKLVRNQHVNPGVINLLVPNAKGRMRDGSKIQVDLLRALALNTINNSDRNLILQLLAERSVANQSTSLVLGLADAGDEETFIKIAWNARNKTIAMGAARKTRDPEAYQVAVLLRNLREDNPAVEQSILYLPGSRRIKKQYR